MTHHIHNDPEFQQEQQAFMLHDGDGIARWLIVPSSTYHWCDFAIYEAVGHEVDDESPLFELKGRRSSAECTAWSNACEPTMTGYIKWDGCTEFSASAHFCDAAESYAKLSDVIQETMLRAHRLMSGQCDSNLDWDEPKGAQMYRAESYALPEPWVKS